MKKLILMILTTCLLCGCQTKKELTKYNEQILDAGFDTFIQLLAYTEDEDTYNKYLKEVNETYVYYNKLFDRYNTYRSEERRVGKEC